jgi:hypothetical protein
MEGKMREGERKWAGAMPPQSRDSAAALEVRTRPSRFGPNTPTAAAAARSFPCPLCLSFLCLCLTLFCIFSGAQHAGPPARGPHPRICRRRRPYRPPERAVQGTQRHRERHRDERGYRRYLSFSFSVSVAVSDPVAVSACLPVSFTVCPSVYLPIHQSSHLLNLQYQYPRPYPDREGGGRHR